MKTASRSPNGRPAYDLRFDSKHQADFDLLVQRASRGDGKAIGAIAVAFTPSFFEAAEAELGKFRNEAEDVVQDFFLFLLEGRWPYVSRPGDAKPWLYRMLRTIARARRSDRERDWGLRDEP
jgi:DNA-directed RNA polymerase specialized sigma24 family protein